MEWLCKRAAEKATAEQDGVIKDLNAQNEELKKVTLQNAATYTPDTAKLMEKCRILEDFRNSFPFKVTDGYLLYNLIRTEVNSDYSRWLIVGQFGNELWQTSLLRPDGQSYAELLRLLSTTKTPQDITEFDMHKTLLWQ